MRKKTLLECIMFVISVLMILNSFTLYFGIIGLGVLFMLITYDWESHKPGKIEAPGIRIGLGLAYFYRTSLPYIYRKTFPGKEKVEGSS
ncbi:MAG: hypothetical protein ACP6IS_09885 [Candidatus Asgardarchaeia archaeon]